MGLIARGLAAELRPGAKVRAHRRCGRVLTWRVAGLPTGHYPCFGQTCVHIRLSSPAKPPPPVQTTSGHSAELRDCAIVTAISRASGPSSCAPREGERGLGPDSAGMTLEDCSTGPARQRRLQPHTDTQAADNLVSPHAADRKTQPMKHDRQTPGRNPITPVVPTLQRLFSSLHALAILFRSDMAFSS